MFTQYYNYSKKSHAVKMHWYQSTLSLLRDLALSTEGVAV